MGGVLDPMNVSNLNSGTSLLVDQPRSNGNGSREASKGDQQSGHKTVGKIAPSVQAVTQDKAKLTQAHPRIAQPDPYQLRDLKAQEDMAYWAMWMFIAAVLTLIITSIGTWLIWRQIKLTRQAVEDTSKATEAMREANEIAKSSQRAWLSIEGFELISLYAHPSSENPAAFTLWFTVKFNVVNSGTRPASDVIFRTAGFPKYFIRKNDPLFVNFIEIFSKPYESLGINVAPNSKTIYEYIGTIEIVHDESYTHDALSVLCTVRYHDGVSPDQRRTIQDFNIFERQMLGNPTRATISVDKIMAAVIKNWSHIDPTKIKDTGMPLVITPNIIPGNLSDMT